MRTIGVFLALTVALSAQEPQPAAELTIRMVSPEPDSYVSGLTTLKAEILPKMLASRVAQILFFADGKQVCNVLDPVAAECEWDAGAEVRPHVFRVVANLIGGGRIVASSRAKGLDQVEKVSVDVVQITAVVTERGRFVSGLQQSSFKLIEDGVAQSIGHFSAEGSPLEIVVAVDVSESMTLAMPQLKNAVKKFLVGAGAQGSSHGRRVQRQHVHADQARDQRGPAHARRRSPVGVGRHRVV